MRSRDVKLLVEIERFTKAGHTVSNAARLLSKRPPLKGRSQDYLREHFYALKRATSPEGKRIRAALAEYKKAREKKPVRGIRIPFVKQT